MNLDDAIRAHYDWKNKLRDAITNQSQLDAATIGRDDCCTFGKWLHGEAGQKYGSRPEFTTLLQKHKAFHAEAGKVALEINGRRFAQATTMIGNNSPFWAASLAVGVAVNNLKRLG